MGFIRRMRVERSAVFVCSFASNCSLQRAGSHSFHCCHNGTGRRFPSSSQTRVLHRVMYLSRSPNILQEQALCTRKEAITIRQSVRQLVTNLKLQFTSPKAVQDPSIACIKLLYLTTFENRANQRNWV